MRTDKTVDERRKAIEDKYRADLAQLEQETKIFSVLPAPLDTYEWNYHRYKLYGRRSSLRLGPCRYESLRKHPDPTLNTAYDLAMAFPDFTPMVFMRDRSGSAIKTKAFADALPEKDTDDAEIMNIAPYWLTIEPDNYNRAVCLHWVTTIADEIVECEIQYSMWSDIGKRFGRLRLEYEYSGRHRDEISRVKTNQFDVDPRIDVIGNCRARITRYGTGDPKTPGQHKVYWEVGNIDPADSTVITLLDRLNAITVTL